jgi:branched-chain amino acid transport system substrate-binding protein
MKKITIAALAALMASSAAQAEIKMGVILGFTGPIESLTPAMADSAELAFKEASDSGKLLGGETISVVRADSTCIDAAAASAAAERMITADGVAGIMGADCSGVTTAIASNVAIPNGVVMVSPSATSPALTDIEDNGYFFRTAPSDARGGQVMAEVVMERGISDVAVTYENSDYGKGLSDSFITNFKAMGGTITATAAHENGKADYSAEVAALSAGGSDVLVVIGYLDQGGRGIIQSSIDTDAFENYVLGDGMIGQSLIDNVDGDGPFRAESYDAAALMVLAMQAGGNADRDTIAKNLMSVANAPGKRIMPGEIARALEILAAGGEVNYEGASNVELTDVGEASGSYKILEITDGAFKTVEVR